MIAERVSPELPAGLVLAGGTSLRMGGRDKALAQLGGRPLVAHVMERLTPQVSKTAISSNGDPMLFAACNVPVLPDLASSNRSGPLSGILAGLLWAQRDAACSHILTAAVDTPFFPADLGARLAAAVQGKADCVAVARSGGRWHPVFSLWPVSAATALAAFLRDANDFSVMRYLERQDFAAADFDPRPDGGDPFFNVNTPEDLAIAETMLGGRET